MPVNIQRLHVINSNIVRSFSNSFSSANISRYPRSTHYIWTPKLLCSSTHVRAYKKLPCLREVCGFVVVTETLQKEFDNFKSSLPRVKFSRLEINPLLQYWNNGVRPSSGVPITMFDKQYLELHCSEVDKLCQWILDTRAEHEKGYKRLLKAVDEASMEGDSSADSLIVTTGTAHGAQGKNKAVVSVACESSTDPAIDITQFMNFDEQITA